jgi:undecaprenyl-diphosphatase
MSLINLEVNLIEFFKNIDQSFFLAVNGFHHPALDFLMFWISSKIIWLPLYSYLLWLIIRAKGIHSLYFVIPAITLLITATDTISTQLFKEVFQRLRPCHNQELKHLVHLVGNCSGLHGFVSSHAANSFGLAVFVGLFLKKFDQKIIFLLLFWAMLISYSRVYLGVHYPADVLVGGLLGSFLGYTFYWLNNLVESRFSKIKLA